GWSNWADGYGTSLELVDPEAVPPPGDKRTEFLGNPVHWRPSGRVGGSPDEAGEGPRGGVLINEILISANQPDRIELINTTEDPVDIGGWLLSSGGQQQGYEIPAETSIPIDGYVTFDADELGIPLSAAGGSLWLLERDQPEGQPRIVDGVVFGAMIDGEAVGRWPDGQGDLTPMLQPTIGDENAGPRIGPLVISELHYHSREEGDRDDLEFIEIFNPTSQPVDVNHWQILGGVEHEIHTVTPIEPFGTLVILSFNPANDRNVDRRQSFLTTYGLDESVLLDGGYKGRLSNGGEKIELARSDGTLQDAVAYDDQAPWPIQADGRGRSLNRTRTNLWGNDPASWVAAVPNPGVARFGTGQGGTEGDMDLDGNVDLSDITDFAMGLIDPQAYFFAYGLSPIVYGDIDGDGDLDFDDIPGLVALLGGESITGSSASVASSAADVRSYDLGGVLSRVDGWVAVRQAFTDVALREEPFRIAGPFSQVDDSREGDFDAAAQRVPRSAWRSGDERLRWTSLGGRVRADDSASTEKKLAAIWSENWDWLERPELDES
ncbi:MAG: lamin tail domain-containing protein, partial [Pirellulales bacterium]